MTADSKPQHYLGLCAIAKDETPYLREWVGYHHYLGFEKIYVYDNDSAVPVRDSVAEFYDAGICDSYTIPGKGMQLMAYNHCLKHHGHEFEWLAFFDLDEFLCLQKDHDARILLRDYEAFSGLSLNWDNFSSSGHLGRPRGFVTGAFRQSLGYSCNSKCIVRPARVNMPFTAHHFLYHEGIAVNADRHPSVGAYTPLAVDRACLNHYSYRSQEDYENKIRRGDATYVDSNPREMAVFYRQASLPVAERTDILPLALEAERMLEQGPPRMRQGITLADCDGFSLPEVLAAMAKYIRLRQAGMAEALFALCYKRFCRELEFLRMGATLCHLSEKKERALALSLECLALAPDAESYCNLLECRTDLEQRDEAERIVSFLLSVADFDQNDALAQRIQEHAARHGLDLKTYT